MYIKTNGDDLVDMSGDVVDIPENAMYFEVNGFYERLTGETEYI